MFPLNTILAWNINIIMNKKYNNNNIIIASRAYLLQRHRPSLQINAPNMMPTQFLDNNAKTSSIVARAEQWQTGFARGTSGWRRHGPCITTGTRCARHPLRASTIELTQLAIRIKIVYLCLVGRERGGERRGVGSNARASSSTCS
jgi:hypothetical protein